ncbi:hypothetical protein DITRI_Ditri02bG0186500 [Diplodiscus trichospermus]
MHDLINDLEQSVVGEICSKLEGDKQQKSSNRTRHFSYVKSRYDGVKRFEAQYDGVKTCEAFGKMSCLRTFLPFKLLWEESSFLTKVVLDELLPTLKCLRVLSLKGGANSIKSMPFGVGKLTNLQRLSDFILGKGQEAQEAKLTEKSGLDRLRLQWSADFDNDARNKEDEEQVLNLLRPQKKLEQLIIENYGGAKLSAWIADSSFKNLLSLELRNCNNCKSLPSIGRLSMLKKLVIRGFNEVNEVGIEFFGEKEPNGSASLETLCFEDMPNWKEWDPCEGGELVSKFPSLRHTKLES